MTQINKIRHEIGEITMDTTEIQRIIRHYYKHYTPIKWTLRRNGQILRKVQPSKIKPGRNR